MVRCDWPIPRNNFYETIRYRHAGKALRLGA